MKTLTINKLLFITLWLFPLWMNAQMTNAQWNNVRWGDWISYNKVFTTTSSTAFVIGTDGWSEGPVIRRTNDGGTTWEDIELNAQIDVGHLYGLSFLDKDNGFVIGAKYWGYGNVLLKTTDNGNTWIDVAPNHGEGNPIVSVNFFDVQNGLVATLDTLYKTINGGTAWAALSLPFQPNDLFFIDANNGYACVADTSGDGLLMKTSNGGQTWDTSLTVWHVNNFFNPLTKVDFVNSTTGFCASKYSNKLYRTTDGGSSWDTIVVPASISDFDFTSTDNGHILNSDEDILRTVDGGQTWDWEYIAPWKMVFINIPHHPLHSFSFFDEQTGFAVGYGFILKYTQATSVTGIKEEKLNGAISLYPNPLIGSQNLTINTSGLRGKCSVQIVNASGQTVLLKEIDAAENNFSVTLSDLNLKAGVYSVTVQTKEERNTEKLIIGQ